MQFEPLGVGLRTQVIPAPGAGSSELKPLALPSASTAAVHLELATWVRRHEETAKQVALLHNNEESHPATCPGIVALGSH